MVLAFARKSKHGFGDRSMLLDRSHGDVCLVTSRCVSGTRTDIASTDQVIGAAPVEGFNRVSKVYIEGLFPRLGHVC